MNIQSLLFCCCLVCAMLSVTQVNAEMYTVQAPGSKSTVEVYLECTGNGTPTVIFEAGLADSSDTWLKVRDLVKGSTRTCVYDRPGYGRSIGNYPNRTAHNAAKLLYQLLQAAGESGQYVLVGFSNAGAIVCAFNAQYGAEVTSILLVDPTPPGMCEKLPRRCPKPNRATVVGGLRLSLEVDIEKAIALQQAVQAEMRHWVPNLQKLSTTIVVDKPLVVIACGRFGPPNPPSNKKDKYAEELRIWHELQKTVTQANEQGRLVVAVGVGHYVHEENARLVADEIRHLVRTTRKDGE